MLFHWHAKSTRDIIRVEAFFRSSSFRFCLLELAHAVFAGLPAFMKDFRHQQIEHIQRYSLKANPIAQYLIPAGFVPTHFIIDQFRKWAAGHLPALSLIRLFDAPTQGVFVILVAASHYQPFQFLIEHDMHIHHILQSGNTCRIIPISDNRISLMQVWMKEKRHAY